MASYCKQCGEELPHNDMAFCGVECCDTFHNDPDVGLGYTDDDFVMEDDFFVPHPLPKEFTWADIW